jgi:hypothetical protein
VATPTPGASQLGGEPASSFPLRTPAISRSGVATNSGGNAAKSGSGALPSYGIAIIVVVVVLLIVGAIAAYLIIKRKGSEGDGGVQETTADSAGAWSGQTQEGYDQGSYGTGENPATYQGDTGYGGGEGYGGGDAAYPGGDAEVY